MLQTAIIKTHSSLSPPYQHHQQEQILLYQIVERLYAEFRNESNSTVY
jgi:hypothetical protein